MRTSSNDSYPALVQLSNCAECGDGNNLHGIFRKACAEVEGEKTYNGSLGATRALVARLITGPHLHASALQSEGVTTLNKFRRVL